MPSFKITEKHLSHIPALRLLLGLGYEYMSPATALTERGGRLGNVVLEGVLARQLGAINRIGYKGGVHLFSDSNIQDAIQKLKNVHYSGLQDTSEKVYDLLTLGTDLSQSIDGDTKSFNLKYIDWKAPENNVFHVVPEFSVECSGSSATLRPDIVLFVNGIPLCVIECKAPRHKVDDAISQTIRNQESSAIPKLFTYAQLVMAVKNNAAKYATTGTAMKFWSVWNEIEFSDEDIATSVNSPLSTEHKDALFSGQFAGARQHFDELEAKGRMVTDQDKAIYCLCRPDRLLDLSYSFVLFEGGAKKIARYQQYFVVKSALARMKQFDSDGIRKGGIVWHTQGSGKSLTMVMLVRALTFDKDFPNHRIVLVTDRTDLDKQLGNTFNACGLSEARATSGRNLVEHIKNKVEIITTLIHKFETAWNHGKCVDESPDIFVLVDESHRTNYGDLAARMRQILPKACFLGFTGTPLMQAEKSSFRKFGDLIEPHYSVRRAVDDKAVLPLLYEGRSVDVQQDEEAMDLWFDRQTADLNENQKKDLKHKYARAHTINQSDKVVYMRAFDISMHYRNNWLNSGFGAQLVAPNKATALKYHNYLNELKYVTSAVVISAPDTREGHEEVGEAPSDDVQSFWKRMMDTHGTDYPQNIIEQFKNTIKPNILIVVDKLLTGFDAPRNTVLYLCKKLRGHTLLQAIARVNRLHEGKEYGYIVDYENVLGELNKALTSYDELAGYDDEDLEDTLTAVADVVKKLPQAHSHLWDVFNGIKHSTDEEQFEVLLADQKKRDEFYDRLSEFGHILAIALSTTKFMADTDESDIAMYKNDMKRFAKLKDAVRIRYADGINYREYEPRIKKLLDTHIKADKVDQLNEPVNIFDDDSFKGVMQELGVYSTKSKAARADVIAHALKKEVQKRWNEDPTLYKKFSELIQKAIDDFRNQSITDAEYLNRVSTLRSNVVSGRRDNMPSDIKDNPDACAYYGVLSPYIKEQEPDAAKTETIAVEATLAMQDIIEKHDKVDFWNDPIAQNKTKNEIDDFLYDVLKNKHGIQLEPDKMDEIIDKIMRIAKYRSKH